MPFGWGSSRLYVATICISSGTTSGVLFNRYMLRPYRYILCLNCRYTGYWGRFLHVIYTLPKALPPSWGPSPKSHWIHNRFFRHSVQIPWSLWTLYRFFGLQRFVWGCNTNFSSGPCRRNGGLRSSGMQNFVDLILENIKTFAFIKYAIVCVPLETPKILFLRHYRAASDGWRTYNLCAACCRDCTPSIHNSSTTVHFHILTLPTTILANVISVYVHHLPSVIWRCIPSFITLSIYHSSYLPPERCVYIT